jgi:hypothetical protein
MIFLWFVLLLFILMVLVGNRHEREEEDNCHSHSDLLYEDEEGLEGAEGGKNSSTPLWKFVTKLEGGKRGGASTNVLCKHDYHQGKPYTGSYTHVRRHLCGVLESDDNKGAIGISIFR